MKRDWLIDIRKQNGLRQIDVAKAANVQRATYSHYENGFRTPSPATAKNIASILGFNWTIFFDSNCGDL